MSFFSWDSKKAILYKGKYSPRLIFRPFHHRCQRLSLRLGEFQCLKSSLFQHNCVLGIQDGGENNPVYGNFGKHSNLVYVPQKTVNIFYHHSQFKFLFLIQLTLQSWSYITNLWFSRFILPLYLFTKYDVVHTINNVNYQRGFNKFYLNGFCSILKHRTINSKKYFCYFYITIERYIIILLSYQ